MSGGRALEQAVRRLMHALDALDSAVGVRVEHDRQHAPLAEQVEAVNSDRDRLAAERDGAEARSRELETSNREAVRRLDEAIDVIRSMIDNDPGHASGTG